MNVPRSGWPEWLPDAAAGLIVAALGLVIAILNYGPFDQYARPPLGMPSPDRQVALLAVVAIVMGAAVGLSRRAPGVALASRASTCPMPSPRRPKPPWPPSPPPPAPRRRASGICCRAPPGTSRAPGPA